MQCYVQFLAKIDFCGFLESGSRFDTAVARWSRSGKLFYESTSSAVSVGIGDHLWPEIALVYATSDQHQLSLASRGIISKEWSTKMDRMSTVGRGKGPKTTETEMSHCEV